MMGVAQGWRKLAVAVAIPLLLSACGGSGMSDLEQFVAEVKARKPTPIKPLPEIKQIETFTYVPGDRRDPFRPESQAEMAGGEGAGGVTPDKMRRKEELEEFPLDSLRMVGTLHLGDTMWGLIKNKEGTIYRVKVGNYMGQNNGQITLISEEEIELTEIIPDHKGGYQERQATVALSE
jgi:type IV pilus assembly protein PilP